MRQTRRSTVSSKTSTWSWLIRFLPAYEIVAHVSCLLSHVIQRTGYVFLISISPFDASAAELIVSRVCESQTDVPTLIALCYPTDFLPVDFVKGRVLSKESLWSVGCPFRKHEGKSTTVNRYIPRSPQTVNVCRISIGFCRLTRTKCDHCWSFYSCCRSQKILGSTMDAFKTASTHFHVLSQRWKQWVKRTVW